jgi:hypothetical protein
MLYHPPYSPDLSLPDYFLFPKLKMKLKGLHFADVAEIQGAITDELKKVHNEEFSAAFHKLYDHTKACVYINVYTHMPIELILKKKKKRYMSLIFKKNQP